MKRLGTAVGLLAGGVLLAAALAGSAIFLPPWQPPGTAEIRIEQGEPLSSIVRKLSEQRIVVHARLFSLWARLAGLEKRVQWGVYRFETPLSAHQVLRQLASGKGVYHRVTIPEGLTVEEIGELLANLGIVDKEKFLEAAADPELLSSLGLRDKGIEGYLFPSTYHFAPSLSEREIIVAMSEQFRKAFDSLVRREAATTPLTAHEVVTLASIIEKETGIDAERPLIAAVFHNRLRLKMPLQSDPTVIYGIKDFNGNLTRKDLQSRSPYNTYRIPGLPPGPICNPGLASLRAALQPADVPYLYFVSRNDGTHLFSETLDAHSQAVKTFQPKQSASGGKKDLVRRR
ncbi:MAG TPA: endolytic transglycosylase MltG [candidate division Zixibacteria bacterium]|nr:endolytic transglycosylase MltG [candidate division Zixibacteria bacterium]